MNALNTGKQAEQMALQYLQRHGLKLIAQNWQCRYGEIDLIMQATTKELVFIEVRYRKQAYCGNALESITPSKQRKIILTAQLFLQNNPQWFDSPCRFDVIAMTGNLSATNIEWLPNAFSS